MVAKSAMKAMKIMNNKKDSLVLKSANGLIAIGSLPISVAPSRKVSSRSSSSCRV